MIRAGNKLGLLLYGCLVAAITLGIYAQDIAYFLHYKLAVPLLLGVGLATALSIILFFAPPILVAGLKKKDLVGGKVYRIYFRINILSAVVISFFSLIVFIAWCG